MFRTLTVWLFTMRRTSTVGHFTIYRSLTVWLLTIHMTLPVWLFTMFGTYTVWHLTIYRSLTVWLFTMFGTYTVGHLTIYRSLNCLAYISVFIYLPFYNSSLNVSLFPSIPYSISASLRGVNYKWTNPSLVSLTMLWNQTKIIRKVSSLDSVSSVWSQLNLSQH